VKARLKDLLPQLEPTAQPAFEVRLVLIDEIGSLGWEHLGVDLKSLDKAAKEDAQITIAALRKRLADPQINVREAAAKAIRTIEKKPEPKKDPDKKETGEELAVGRLRCVLNSDAREPIGKTDLSACRRPGMGRRTGGPFSP